VDDAAAPSPEGSCEQEASVDEAGAPSGHESPEEEEEQVGDSDYEDPHYLEALATAEDDAPDASEYGGGERRAWGPRRRRRRRRGKRGRMGNSPPRQRAYMRLDTGALAVWLPPEGRQAVFDGALPYTDQLRILHPLPMPPGTVVCGSCRLQPPTYSRAGGAGSGRLGAAEGVCGGGVWCRGSGGERSKTTPGVAQPSGGWGGQGRRQAGGGRGGGSRQDLPPTSTLTPTARRPAQCQPAASPSPPLPMGGRAHHLGPCWGTIA
jgi:hypothetical protein